MSDDASVDAARHATARAAALLQASPALGDLDPTTRARLVDDLALIQAALAPRDPYAFPLAADPRSLYRGTAGERPESATPPVLPGSPDPAAGGGGTRTAPATATLAERAGALLDEISFASFVGGLVSSTYDAVVEAGIRQLEAFADLIGSVAKSVDQFTVENITPNQARDWLVERYPGDLRLEIPQTREGSPTLVVAGADDFGGGESPAWLSDFGLEGEVLTSEMAEERLVPLARQRMGESRQQLLATMVLLGMSRITVSNGRISARLMFRAAARDKTGVDFAVSRDPGGETWGSKGSADYQTHQTLVSTVGVNAQSETTLQADLYGSVELNFVSETLPLDRFADNAQLALLQRNAKWTPPSTAAPVAPPVAAPAPAAPAPAAPAPAAPMPIASQPAPVAATPAPPGGGGQA